MGIEDGAGCWNVPQICLASMIFYGSSGVEYRVSSSVPSVALFLFEAQIEAILLHECPV